ncbi:MAG TPA: NAD(P)-binding domain-containing protein [Candidatus Synoicihabitans sp.]|nr:NAD(P)-binding domain-containing protein [Candidatus Synoicihabitans sp.]
MQKTPDPTAAPARATPSVAFLGLGPMGTALARCAASAGYSTVGWNRSPIKSEFLDAAGVQRATSAEEAIERAQVVIVCVAHYSASRAILEQPGVRSALRGRILIQLSTGRPSEARALARWAEQAGARYIDGAILVTPSQIGTPEAAMLLAGNPSAFAEAQSILRALAPNLDWVGTDAGAAAALDLAFLSHFFGGLLGFYHGARILEAEGLPVARLGQMIEQVAPALGTIVAHDANRISSEQYLGSESTLQTCANALNLIHAHAEEVQLDKRFAHFAYSLFSDGVARGYGAEDAAALMKVLRAAAGSRSSGGR